MDETDFKRDDTAGCQKTVSLYSHLSSHIMIAVTSASGTIFSCRLHVRFAAEMLDTRYTNIVMA